MTHTPLSNNFKVPPLSTLNIRQMTEYIRKRFRITTPYFPIVEFVEFVLPKVDKDFLLIIANEDELRSNYGETTPATHTITLRNDVYERALHGVARDRFTVAHEFAHYYTVDSKMVFARTAVELPLKPYEDSEWQANCFAGELLIPVNHELIKKCSVEDIMKYCGVSRQAAEIGYHKIKKSN